MLLDNEVGTAPERDTGVRGDLLAGAASLLLLGLAIAVGLTYTTERLGTYAAPVYGVWLPHVGYTSPVALLIAVVVVLHGPVLAARLRFGALLGAGYAGAVAFTVSLALIDGWHTGIAGRLEAFTEYLHEVPRITDIPAFLRTFTQHIPMGIGTWTTHVAGHPPGATLFYVWLDRIGVQHGGPAGIATILVGALAAVAVPVTLRVLADEDTARAAVPFLVLFPGAVWVGVSADGMFAGIAASGIALLAVGTAGRSPRHALAALAGGLLLGYAVFCSYGLVVLGPLVLALVWRRRAWRALGLAALGALAVLAAFTLAGFWWLDGYHALVHRYYQGLGASRPYAYWVWANLACLVLSAGPLLGPVLLRAARSWRAVFRRDVVRGGVVLLVAGAVLAVVAADVSGLSKAETERIWLPFAVWLTAGAVLLPAASRRWWLAGQAATALLVNHLLLTSW